MRDVAIIGVGMHPWGKFRDKTFVDLGEVATIEALKDAGIKWVDVQAVACGVYLWGGMGGMLAGHHLAARLGETGIPIVNVSNACATAGSALRTAYMMIAAELCDVALAVGLDMSPEGFFPAISEDPKDLAVLRWKAVGIPNPGYWALECRRRMETYGTTQLHLAKAKVAASKHGALNPHARYRREFSVDEVMNSPMVCDPLRLYEICATSDGAAAVVVCSLDTARKYTAKPIIVAAASLASSEYGDVTIRIPQLSSPVTPLAPLLSESAMAARMAYTQAGIGPEDVDLVELPDNSSWHYLQYLETMGFCNPGEAERLLDEEATQIGGKLPICPSGGAASFGEAVAAQGLAQVCELVWQLRHQAGSRQVEGAKVGMAQVYGAQGNNAAVILKR
ncbi:lipid-transfer protein [Chloroflexota bacterium]